MTDFDEIIIDDKQPIISKENGSSYGTLGQQSDQNDQSTSSGVKDATKNPNDDINGGKSALGNFDPNGFYKSILEFKKKNDYQQNKTYAEGCMNFTLFAQNASQLKSIIDNANFNQLTYVTIVLIVISLIFQFLVGAGLLIRLNTKEDSEIEKASKLNVKILIGSLLITCLNILILIFKE